jgi:hypothetical protein
MYDAGMTSLILLLALAASPPVPPVIHDRCEIIILNDVYDLDIDYSEPDAPPPKPFLRQVLFVDTHPPGHSQEGQEYVIDWRMFKHEGMRPVRDQRHGGWVMMWQDGDTLRCVRCQSFVDQPTGYDIEVDDRGKNPQYLRRKLTTLKPPPPLELPVVFAPEPPPPDPQ